MRKSYHPYAATTVVLWSLAFVFTRIALRSFSPFPLGFLRYLCASVALGAMLAARRLGLPDRRALPLLALAGATGFFLYMLAFNTGCQTVTAATSSVVISLVPLMTALMARVAFRERLSARKYAAMGIAFAGVVTLALMRLGYSSVAGVAYLLVAAVLLSAYNLLQRRLARLCHPLVATSYGIFFGTLMLGVFAPQGFRELAAAPPAAVGCVAVLGVFCGAVAYAAWTKAMSLARDTASVSNYMFVEPLLTAVFGFVIAGETVDAATYVGGAIILAGLGLFYFGDARLTRRPPA